MNNKLLFSLFFILVIIFSFNTIEASDVNVTDSDLSTAADILQDNDETILNSEDGDSVNDVKNQSEILSSTNTIYYKGDYSITLKDSNSSKKLSNKTIEFIINNVHYNSTTNDDGVAFVNLNILPGRYSVIASFIGDELFSSCNYTSNLQILSTIKATDISKYYKGSTKYTATFYTGQGNVLANKWVNIIVNGKTYSKKTNNNGVASLDINLNPGSYKIVSTDPVTGLKITTNFIILSTISSNNLNKVSGDSRKFSAKFFKSNGKALSKQYIKFKFKGKIYKIKTNNNGVASLSLKKLKPGTYKIICYNKDGLSKTHSIKVFKRKASTKLTTYHYQFFKNENKEIKVKLSTSLGDSSCSGKIIKIKINGKTYSKKTNNNGFVYLKLHSLNKGVYNIEYKYDGNKFFKASGSKNSIIIYDTHYTQIKVKGTSSFGYGSGTQLKVQYTAGGVPLIKKSVHLVLNGKKYTKTTDNNGIVSIPVGLSIGQYNVDYKTNNESQFYGTSGSFDINVFKRGESKVIWKSGSSFKDNSQTFKVLVTGLDGKPVSGGSVILTIDSETYYASVSSNGYATVKTSVDIGQYKVSVKYNGNNNYLPSKDSVKSVNVKLSKFGKGINEKNAVALSKLLKSSSHCKVGTPKLKALVKSLTKGLTNNVDKAKAIFNYVRDTLDYSYYYDTKYGSSKTLKLKRGNCVDHSHLLVAMFRTAGLHARYVHGTCHFIKSGDTTGHVWTQVKLGKNWVCADAVSYKNSLGKIKNWNTKSYSIHGKYASLPF